MAKVEKICSMCKKAFRTIYKNKNLCSFDCKMAANRERSLIWKRTNRRMKAKNWIPCIICGHNIITEIHHDSGGAYPLCPTHHALITRNRTSLKNMMKKPSRF